MKRFVTAALTAVLLVGLLPFQVLALTPQTITFDLTLLPATTYGDAPLDISSYASVDSTLTVEFASRTAGVCTVAGTTVTIVAAGDCTIRASQPGDGVDFLPAPPVDQTFTIAPADQAIGFTSSAPLSAVVGGASYTVAATATSGLTVTFTSATTPVCTIAADVVTFVSAGTCTIRADQAGDSNYNAAPQVQQDVTVGKGAQATLAVTGPASATYGAADATITTSGGSGSGEVSFSAGASTACSIVSGTLHVLSGTGTCAVTATRAADANYTVATSAPFDVAVGKASQAISFGSLGGKTFGDAPFTVSATGGGSGNPVTFSSTTTSVCTVSGTTVTIAGGGTCTVDADQAGDSNYNAAPSVPQDITVDPASQATLTVTGPASATYGAADATITTSGGSGSGEVSFSAGASTACSIVSGTLHVLSGTGTCAVTATRAADANYTVATSAPFDVTVGKGAQATLAVTGPASATYGAADATITTSGGSGSGEVSFSAGASTACSIVSGTLHVLSGTGTCAVTATRAADANYTVATSAPFDVAVGKASQAISFGSLGGKTFGDAPFTVSATGGGSGNPVTFSSTTTSVCTVSGTTVTIAGGGTCTVDADQAGDSNYNAAPQETQGFTVAAFGSTPQAIGFGALAGKTYGNAPFTVSATGGASGNPVTFSSATTPVCTVSGTNGTTVTIVAAGDCTIRANQAGNVTYAAAPQVDQTFTIAQADQVIIFGALAGKTYGNAPFTVSATGGASGNPVTFSSATTPVCTVSGTNGTTVTIVAAGDCTIRANQAGNADYNAAPQAQQSFAVGKAAQATLAVTGPASATYGAADATISTSGGSGGGTVTFGTGTSTACSIVSGKLHVTAGTGTCVVSATKAADGNYAPTTSSPFTVTVGKASQAIIFGALGGKTYGTRPFTVSATGGASGNPVTFSSATTPVCTVSGTNGTTVTIVAAGTCTINATQAGSSNYIAAMPVPRSFVIAKVAPVCPTPGAKTVVMNVALSGAAGCTDIENDVLSYAIVTNPIVTMAAHGTAVISNAGTWTYTPTVNYVGTDSFSFNASDGTKVSGAMKVSLTITNHQVDALNDSAVVTATASTVIDVIHSTSAAGTAGKDNPGTGDTGQPLKITAVTQGAHGGVTTNGSTVTYDPAGCVTGTDLFTYTISDGLTSDTASVIVNIARPGTNGLSSNPITDTPTLGLHHQQHHRHHCPGQACLVRCHPQRLLPSLLHRRTEHQRRQELREQGDPQRNQGQVKHPEPFGGHHVPLARQDHRLGRPHWRKQVLADRPDPSLPGEQSGHRLQGGLGIRAPPPTRRAERSGPPRTRAPRPPSPSRTCARSRSSVRARPRAAPSRSGWTASKVATVSERAINDGLPPRPLRSEPTAVRASHTVSDCRRRQRPDRPRRHPRPLLTPGGLWYSHDRGERSPMNTGFGAYFALFSEIGMLLLVTTLAGVAAGYWVDQRLGTLPVFVLVGFLAGAGIGTVGIYRLITRFLKRFD